MRRAGPGVRTQPPWAKCGHGYKKCREHKQCDSHVSSFVPSPENNFHIFSNAKGSEPTLPKK